MAFPTGQLLLSASLNLNSGLQHFLLKSPLCVFRKGKRFGYLRTSEEKDASKILLLGARRIPSPKGSSAIYTRGLTIGRFLKKLPTH